MRSSGAAPCRAARRAARNALCGREEEPHAAPGSAATASETAPQSPAGRRNTSATALHRHRTTAAKESRTGRSTGREGT
jgi:hypothetical protein